ncbi:MAG: inositol monophosphatase family protein, partial [Pseudomonadota bacterium]
MIIDPEKVAALVAEIAEEEIMSRFGALAESDIDTKSGPQDYVTAADHAAEARLEKALLGLYPGAVFIGEEGVAAEPDLVDHLDQEKGAFWIVDPLDGTRNFVQGRREFGTIVALVENGEVRQGWIYAVPDRGFAIASKGDGVTWRGEKALPVLNGASAFKGYRAVSKLSEPWKSKLIRPLKESYETEPIRCSAYGYINLVRGRKSFGLYARCSPWDHAAGALMLTENSGRAAYMDDGAAYAPRLTVGRPLLVTSREPDWTEISETLLA